MQLGLYLGILTFIALLVPLHRSWAIQVLLVPLLLVFPGFILLRALRVPGRAISSFPVYVPCASLIVLLVSGLVMDVIGPIFGVTAPLRPAPLLVSFEVICLTLLSVSLHAPSNVDVPWRTLGHSARFAWPFLLPLLAAAGALRLNNGHGDGIAVAGLCASILTLVCAFAFASRLDKILLAVILYAVALGMLWSFSLRGKLGDGFDIANEYNLMQHTVLTGVWHASHPGDAYGAMLSVTVLPAEIHALSGVQALLVFSVIYPILFALFPVAVFHLSRRLVSRRWSFLAAAFLIGQYYYAEMVGFARTEIALLFFVPLIAAILESRMQRRAQWALVALLGFALVVSHYSTTYLAITIVGLLLPLQWAVSWLRDIPRITGAAAVAFVAMLVGAVIWYGPVTHSTSNLAQFAQLTSSNGFDILPNRVPEENLLSSYLQGNTKTPIAAEQYAKLVHAQYAATVPYVTPLPNAGLPQYTLRDSIPPSPPIHWSLGYNVLNLGDLIANQLAYIPAGIGALLLAFRRRVPVIARLFGLVTLATLFILAVVRLSGTIAIAYGEERALLQGMALYAIAVSWSMQQLTVWRDRLESALVTVSAVSLAFILIESSYLTGVLVGGGSALNLANNGVNYEEYYVTIPELASANWLGEKIRPDQLIYADEYAQLPIIATDGLLNGLTLDVTPLTINQHAWVYASQTNVVDRQAFALFQYHLASYVFPYMFLDNNFDLVYTNGSSEVFHR